VSTGHPSNGRASPPLIALLIALFLALLVPVLPAAGRQVDGRPGGPATAPFVARAGTGLTLDGKPYRFTGYNVYNANSRNNCWYSLGDPDGELAAALDAVGPGEEAIRAWFYQGLATTAGTRDWSAFDQTLNVARARGIKVIVTLADQWGSCDSGTGAPSAYKDETWYVTGYRTSVAPGNLRPYRDWVAEIVKRYRRDPAILAWQLMNEAEVKPALGAECSANAAAILKAWAADVAGLVKSLDSRHLVSLGTMGSGQCGAQYTDYQSLYSLATVDLCEVHDYDDLAPMPGDQWNGLAFRLEQCATLGKPLIVGEVGLKNMALDARALALGAKFEAQFGAGIAGALVWALRDDAHGGSSTTDYDAGEDDPLVSLFTRY
jgi:mannan endo-1,4-beta-mannosidase